MPATGGSRAVHAPASKPTAKTTDKGKMATAQQQQPLRRESSAAVTTQRPGIKTRAYSAPSVPKSEGQAGSELDRTDEDNEGEEIADDAFFQRYHFPQPILSTQEEEDSSAESSSDTEGPLSPTHHKDRQPSQDAASEPSSVSAYPDKEQQSPKRAEAAVANNTMPVGQQRLGSHHAGPQHRRHWRAELRQVDLHPPRPRAA
ncbi:hypothetical protein IG631_16971 [Alternaria alternata]|nr:hypothetical protein IG631_16971 [Alternaria alternata]